jgi:hypothetical protein
MLSLALLATHAGAEVGLKLRGQDTVWPRWQARINLVTTPMPNNAVSWQTPGNGLRLRNARVLSDYYFATPGVGNGFRASGGVLWGPRGGSLNALAPQNTGPSLSLSSQNANLGDASRDGLQTTPYLGVGYTGLFSSSGWNITADLGLAALGGIGLTLNRGAPASPFDDPQREWRLTPVLQLGVSHAF